MSTKAPLCGYDGCRNPTWDGFCYAHINATSGAITNGTVSAPVKHSKISDASIPEVWSDVSGVFTDIDDVVSVESIRNEVRATVTAAVSLEAYRHFKKIDVADQNQRNRMALMLRQTISAQLNPEPIAIGRNDAIDLINSSSDEFGRSIEDSAGLISYGLTKEWQMGQSLPGVTTSPDGTPYSNEVDDFITVIATGELQSIIDKQFGRELSRFDAIVIETTGKHARNQSPFHPALIVNDDESVIESTYYLEQRAREIADRQHEVELARAAEANRVQAERDQIARNQKAANRSQQTKRVIGGLGALAGIAINASIENGQRKAANREHAEQKQRNQEWDHLRNTMQQEADEKKRRRNR